MRIFTLWSYRKERAIATLPVDSLPESPSTVRRSTYSHLHIVPTTHTETIVALREPHGDPINYFPSCLPRTLLTSNLGTWNRQYQLRFCCVIASNPPAAVFTCSEKFRFAKSWLEETMQPCSVFKARCRWRNGLPQIRSPCTVRAIIKNRWQYKICRKAILKWDAEQGFLMVDYAKLLADYTMQERSKKNRKRVNNIVRRYHELEEKVLRNETGGSWARYGDWDIFPATHAEVAQACRYEGHGFEAGLGRVPGKSKKYRMRRCLKDLTKTMKRIVLK